uniref:Berberine/berberine-like domain-containing protein n=1 Tax=Compsopogon caeruleus TaxID=31354 RepID=A0A7S1XB08_9RHOD
MGGQSNFGVITKFKMQLFDCPPQILGGLVLYSIEQAATVTSAMERFCRKKDLPLECSVHLYALSLSPDEKALALQICYLGDPNEGKEVLRELVECAPCLDNQSKVTTYQNHQVFSDSVYRVKGIPSYWRSRYVREDVSIPIDTIVKVIEVAPVEAILVIEHYGGKVRDFPTDATAFPHRDQDFVITMVGFGFANPERRKVIVDWINASTNSLEAVLGDGSPLNYDGHDSFRSFGTNLPRLRELKRRYDPDNFFRCNVNIQPAEVNVEKTSVVIEESPERDPSNLDLTGKERRPNSHDGTGTSEISHQGLVRPPAV